MNYRLRAFVTTIVLFVLLFSSVYVVKASSISDENIIPLQQKGLSVLSEVVNLDIPNYAVSSTVYNSSDKNLVSQENVGYYLTYIQSVPPSTGQASNRSFISQPNNSKGLSQGGSLNVLCTFTNGALQTLYVREKIGIPTFSNSEVDTTTTSLAKTFLSNYQSFTNEALYGNLESTLANIDERKNCTQMMDDVRLEVIVANDETLFKWTAYPDGIIAPSKFVALCYKDGFLAYFNDNWQLHKVGSTNVVLSEDQASEIALQSANEYYSSLNSNTTKVQTNYFNKSNVCLTALLLDGSADDALTLYPVWRIGIAFNEWYGNIYGVQVDIWADTGQIRSVTGQYSSLTPKTTSAMSDMSPELSKVQSPVNQYPVSEGSISIALTIFMGYLLLFMSITLVAFILVKKPKLRSSLSSFKSPSLRIHSLVLATLMLSLVMLPIMTASAAPSNAAVIWGSESTGQFDDYQQPYPPQAYWRKTYNETIAQGVASDFIHQQFVDTGVYASVNHQGDDSYKNQVLGDIYSTSGYLSLASNYARLAVVYFDHGVGLSSGTGYTEGIFHYMVEDNEGTKIGSYGSASDEPSNGIYDADIYTRTSATAQNSITFAFINTCLSASYNNAFGELNNDPYYTSYGITQGILPDQSCRSLPYAFTHRQVAANGPGFNVASQISSDGYDNPDHGSQVYIGFPKGSAALSQIIPFNDNELFYGAAYWAWVDRFFATAVTQDNSVNNALDIASIQTWGSSFGNSPLKTGFTPFWPINNDINGNWPTTCTMAVYGNGLIVLDSFSNNFNDYNYNNWTVSSGSWSAASGKLTNSPGTSLIATNSLSTTDRHVRATVRTTQSGVDSWDVPWVVAKLGTGGVSYNSVYGLIHTNGLVELACFNNGQKTLWNTPSNLSPYDEHVIDIDTVGNTAYMYVDGTLYLTETHTCFGANWGKTALMASGNSAGVFNEVSVLKQSYANNQWSDSLTGTSINTNLWAPIQSNGGSVWENGNLYVNAPSGYTGWSQAGIVTQNPCSMLYTCVSVNVADFNALDEMHIQISNSKITSSDPINDPNLYRVGKMRDQSDTVVVQRRVNGAFTTLYSYDWHGATGKLSVLVYGGVISFYENDVWLYSENFALPSSSCYISCYTSSNTRPGTDAFNNFEFIST